MLPNTENVTHRINTEHLGQTQTVVERYEPVRDLFCEGSEDANTHPVRHSIKPRYPTLCNRIGNCGQYGGICVVAMLTDNDVQGWKRVNTVGLNTDRSSLSKDPRQNEACVLYRFMRYLAGRDVTDPESVPAARSPRSGINNR